MSGSKPTGDAGPPPDHDWEEGRRILLDYFARRGLRNAEDLAHDTITRVWKWLQEGNEITGQDGFKMLLYGFARNIFLEQMHQTPRAMVELSPSLPSGENKKRGLTAVESTRYLDQLLDQLSEREQRMLTQAEQMPQTEMAKAWNVEVRTLRVRLYRIRQKLKRSEEESKKHTNRE